MALSYSQTVNHARLDAIESTVGTAAKLRIYSGSAPAVGAAATGVLLVEMILASDWMNAASAGAKTKLGTWSGAGVAAGTAGYFRIVDTAGTTTGLQGTATATGGGGDMILDNASIAVSQTVTVNSFTITAANT